MFTPFKEKLSTNPRYEALYILGRVNDTLRNNDDCDAGKKRLERDETSEEASSNVDSSLVPHSYPFHIATPAVAAPAVAATGQ